MWEDFSNYGTCNLYWNLSQLPLYFINNIKNMAPEADLEG